MPHQPQVKYRLRFLPADVCVEVDDGCSLLEAARRAGYMLRTECGGQGTCRRCKVRLASGQVFMTGQPNLTVREKDQGYVLACLARIAGDLEIHIPARSEFTFARTGLPVEWSPGEHPGKEIRARGATLSPLTQRLALGVPQPSLQDNSSDYDRLIRQLSKKGFPGSFHADLEVLRSLGSALRQQEGRICVLLHAENGSTNILEVTAAAGQEQALLGLAVDIGTTTLFARLLDLKSGEVVAEASDFNGQISCGADVIHRIIYAGKKGGGEELQKLALEGCDRLLREMLKASDRQKNQVVAAVVAGNATMEHLFLGLNPRTIREEPYVPSVTHFPTLRARETGLDIFPRAPVLLSPSVASYVGGDITAGLLAAGVHRNSKLCLYVDLGTNGEVALGNSEWLTACACSAGPAFEGSGVRYGMRALPGAIDQVKSEARSGQLIFRVLGGGPPQGICGSGLIDLLAELYTTRRLNARGKFNPESDPQRIRASGSRAELVLVEGAQIPDSNEIVISETDIDNLIRTKGAIFAGIMTLLKGVGLTTSAIERVVIAGGFGRYLDIENAIRIGMLPDLPRERFEYIGNGSLRGAGLALLSRQMREELELISRRITYFELSSWPGYMDEFMAALFLPHTDAALFPSIKLHQAS